MAKVPYITEDVSCRGDLPTVQWYDEFAFIPSLLVQNMIIFHGDINERT